MVNTAFWKGRRVLVTGHTGFKGSWLTLWLRELGADVTGYSADLPTEPALYALARLSQDCRDVRGDIGDEKGLNRAFAESRPEVVFHLAAQSLVRESYRLPRETWRVNVSGTLALLEAVRASGSVKATVVATTDKVYENREGGIPFREEDPLGGHDPYSASKAACEILCESWRRSFMAAAAGQPAGLATARAGNVIGGGDFAPDRLIPDFVRAANSGSPVRLRYPGAVRPWQHVLEPLSGYLTLAERLCGEPAGFSRPFNFGPSQTDVCAVSEVADAAGALLGVRWEREGSSQPHESGLLRLDSSLAAQKMAWSPRLRFAEALRMTCEWYMGWRRGEDPRAACLEQIRRYQGLPQLREV